MDSVEPPPTTGSPQEPSQAPSPPSGSKGDQPSQPPKKATARKRTKTGCLTCRRRRIKCDEGKPTCNNCIKSKRDCEGYSQRLTFKEPLGSFPSSHLYGHPVYHRQAQQQLVNAQLSAAQTKAASSQEPLAAIAPKPPPVDYSGAIPLPFGHGYGSPSDAGGSGFNQPQQLPSPPFLGPDSNLLPNPLVQPIYGELPAHGEFFEYTPAPPHGFTPAPVQGFTSAHAQGFQHHPDETDVSPVFTGHPLPMPGPDQSLISPGSGGEGMNQPRSTEEEYWDSDDEASMAESDDEVPQDPHLFHLQSNDLGIQVARRLEPVQDLYGVRIRSFGGLVDENILDTYTPSSASSPLNDSQTASVFWHFVNVTGQSMSLYERHPFDPTPMFRGHPVPKQRQHIWTYTFPIMAFNHPALMQAMLALGSLQMAKLQGAPPTAAMKHYHLSLRRTAKNYQSPHKRTQPATLAATLLLGFYEVWNSDHDKWCKHMWGARAIIRDMPLRRLTREVLAYKRRQKEEMLRNHQCNEICFASHGDLSADPGAVDTELIFQITGQRVDYDLAQGHVIGGSSRPSRLTERDVETYEQIRDLYWWYCKMDVYQSFLGGTRPLMEYQQWTQCSPRGPFGRIDSIYGSFDFSLLLLGRVADFASRDLGRKRKARKAQGPGPGQGPPGMGPGGGPPPGHGPPGMGPGGGPPPGHGPPGMDPGGGPPPGQGPGPGPGFGRGQSPPSFPGLMPTSGRVTIPRGFTPPRESSPSSDSAEDIDIDVSTANAIQEWEEIRHAFEVFRARLGPDFEPLGPDVVSPEMTPFGPALTYRTYSIAGIWMTYYMGLIALHRAHPSMPPVAVIAAGMAAQQTGRWANEIARICAGLHEDTTHVTTTSTLVGAAFIESCFPLFVAGVQFRDLAQRHWAIRRLRDIARLTGFQSARQIAEGCESGWHKAAELGRGPPYHSPPELGPLFPEPVWNRPRRIDRRIMELEAAGKGEGDGRLVLAKSEQTHYALGLLGVEQDLDTLGISDGEGEGGGVGVAESEGEEDGQGW